MSTTTQFHKMGLEYASQRRIPAELDFKQSEVLLNQKYTCYRLMARECFS